MAVSPCAVCLTPVSHLLLLVNPLTCIWFKYLHTVVNEFHAPTSAWKNDMFSSLCVSVLIFAYKSKFQCKEALVLISLLHQCGANKRADRMNKKPVLMGHRKQLLQCPHLKIPPSQSYMHQMTTDIKWLYMWNQSWNIARELTTIIIPINVCVYKNHYFNIRSLLTFYRQFTSIFTLTLCNVPVDPLTSNRQGSTIPVVIGWWGLPL